MRKNFKSLSIIPARVSSKKIKPEYALKLLKDGNERFIHGHRSTPQLINPYELEELAQRGESPFGIVLTCSDSHIPIENLFDIEIGSLFVYRVTGNIVSDLILAGMEHALAYYEISLIVVLGHSDCNAMRAAYNYSKKHLKQVLSPPQEKLITSILEANQKPSHPEELAWKNIRHSLKKIKQNSPMISEMINKGRVKLIGASFHPASGAVQFTRSNPRPARKKAA
ncbi:hypothetical protein EBS43_04340 [bacterium]|jgi:carbonic anhydrase|nr:hypothetical protein [bacterium]